MTNVKKSHIFMTLLFISILILSNIVIFKIRIIFPSILDIKNIWILQGISSIISFFTPILIFMAINNKSLKNIIPLEKLSFKNLIAIIFLGFTIQPLLDVVASFTNLFFRDEISSFIDYFSNINYFKSIFIIAIIPAITEELTIRGIILSGYKNKTSICGILVSALYFGLMHLTFTQLLYTFVAGIIFAYVVKVTNSIYSSMIMHFILNATQISLAYISKLMLANYSDTNTEVTNITNDILEIFGNEQTFIFFNSIYKFMIFSPFLIVSILMFRYINKENIKKLKQRDLELKNLPKEEKEKTLGLFFWINIIIYLIVMLFSILGDNYGL